MCDSFSVFFKVTGPKELWGWLKQEFLPNIYSQAWYNGLEEKTDGYTANKMSIMIGMPWMRQLRIKKSKLRKIIFLAVIQSSSSKKRFF